MMEATMKFTEISSPPIKAHPKLIEHKKHLSGYRLLITLQANYNFIKKETPA